MKPLSFRINNNILIMRKILLIMLSLLSVLQMGAQKTIDLSGDWNFEIDRQDIGEKPSTERYD